ncbi:hypothetical protein M378DRAFT_1055673 [Amanita muscaria Koide BX008]|uniref:ATP-dependent DNA helicase n=1 Tax=Amanita muscaria (strain Koide BX008) TaxID=946122 RepID=A0A0C2WEL5_AMAMK|nr:hypothetical protein M378DRAFT_1055673 [Amanita muscaria Koide BX008]
MDDECRKCNALHWRKERLTRSTNANPKFGTCCLDGKVSIPSLQEPPRELWELYNGTSLQSTHFLDHINSYNNAFAMVSLEHGRVNLGPGPDVFVVRGEVRHRAGSLLPDGENPPLYAQLYFQTPGNALEMRMGRGANVGQRLNPQVMQGLRDTLERNNHYIALYKTAYDRLRELPETPELHVSLHFNPIQDQRRYNLPTAEEVAVLMPNGNQQATTRDVILFYRGGPLRRIAETNPAYQPLHYVLLFPRGEHGWHPQIPLSQPDGEPVVIGNANEKVTQMEYYAYRFHQHTNESNHIFLGRTLFQKYAVDAWSQIEQSRANFIRHNQDKLRVELYRGLVDAVNRNDHANLDQLGRRVILPSSFVGGSRYMYQLYQDSLALARYFGKPDYFFTVTANPQWPEICNALLPQQQAKDRPDLVTRVFREKIRMLLEDLKKGGALGKHVGHVYTIEFQKRGLPHVHILIFMAAESHIHDAGMVDQVISAQIPDPQTHPVLHQLVTTLMVHRPCGAHGNRNSPCLKDGKCSKGYPKPWIEETTLGHNGYAVYARPNNGRTAVISGGVRIDNRWIVPHSPYFLMKLRSHSNLECCISIQATKYIHKYIYKGHDMATVQVHDDQDEVQRYLDARYVSACESFWRIFHYDVHEEAPNVVRLAIHLEGQHTVVYNADDNPQNALAAGARDTTLTAFFKANAAEEDGERHRGRRVRIARSLLYQEFPQRFVWKDRKWTLRKKGFAIGRMFNVHPKAGDLFYLRTLLTAVRGPTSFRDLRTVNGIEHHDFKSACNAMGLLEDDGEWRQCLQEASLMQLGKQLRSLFATILIDCAPNNPLELWDQFKANICDDLQRTMVNNHIHPNPTEDEVYHYGLFLINKVLERHGKSVTDFGLPEPQGDWERVVPNRLIAEQQYNLAQQLQLADENIPKLNIEQRAAYERVKDAVMEGQPQIFFIHGPAGTGKTFCYNTLCYFLRGHGKIVLCVASSGIASLLLKGGRTAHSTFRIPLNIYNGQTCSVTKQSKLADLLRVVDLIIWDEVPMQSKFCQEAVDITLRDIRNNQQPFGGITVVFGGDFQQILPVVLKGTREQIVSQSIRKSYIWNHIQVLKLTQNMRLENRTAEEREFAQWLLDVGHGRNSNAEGCVRLWDSMLCHSVDGLVMSIYPGITMLDAQETHEQYFLERTILAPRNDEVAALNGVLLDKMPGRVIEYQSADSLEVEQGADADVNYPVEFLNTINASGLPPSKLRLKIGCPIMILRNLDPRRGLCNGTRAILLRASQRVLEVKVIGGDFEDERDRRAFIPRIDLVEEETVDIPFKFRRRQFPVRLAFAMTVNKAQGQSVKHVGLDLQTPVFTHGQLYVALSRCTSSLRIKVLLKDVSGEQLHEQQTETKNIVYPEALLD